MNPDAPLQIIELDRLGGGAERDIEQIDMGSAPGERLVWVHLDYSQDSARRWLGGIDWLDPIVRDNLLDDDTRPRSISFSTGLFLSLRGVNLNPGADPEDMIAVRMWIDESYIITANKRRLLSLDDLRDALRRGTGPKSSSRFMSLLVEQLAGRAETVVERIEEEFEAVEDAIIAEDNAEHRSELSELRRKAIRLKRFFTPQREALRQLLDAPPGWLKKSDRMYIREAINTFSRFMEELDSIRDRAIVLQEELLGRLSETLNRRMYVLSLVATLFLPLGFITGLLGINVGGIPGAESPFGFAAICAGIVVIVAGMIVFLKARKWF